MKAKSDAIIMQNRVFGLIALATGSILLIPLVAIQFSKDWDWKLNDFVIIGALLLGFGSMFVIVARRAPKHWGLIGIMCVVTLLYVWAELAVGIFTTLGS